MTFRNRYFFINLLLCTSLVISGSCIFTGCTGETDIDRTAGNGNLPSDGTRLTVRATASGFQLPAQDDGSAPTTRTPIMEGTSTIFQPGDAIGLFCVRKNASGDEYIAEDIRNLKMTYTTAADGTGTWKAPTAELTPRVYTDAVTYFAYYPYTEALTTANVSNEQTIREWFKTNKPLATDMRTLAELAANDLMTATALPSLAAADRGTLALSFKHEYALLVVKPKGEGGVCIPPAGVTAYSYYAGAKSKDWGIDRNVGLGSGNDFKMKINGRKACEMSDGTYRILTQPTTIGSQISCNYTTSNGGLLLVDVSGSSISSGFKANTCYTLEVHVTGVKGSEVERAVQSGDFVYQHNGKIEIYPGDGEVDANGKIPDYAYVVGVVVTAEPMKMTDTECNSKGWNHAYVMGVNALPSGKFPWMKDRLFPIPYPPVEHMNIAETYMNGYAETELMLAQSPLSDFPIFEALKQYRDNNSIPAGINRSPWFIPSIGQWFDVMINLCGKSPHDFYYKDIVAVSQHWGAWTTNKEQTSEMLAKADSYLAKIGATFLMLSNSDNQCFWLTSHFNLGQIWMFFYKSTSFSIEPVYGHLDGSSGSGLSVVVAQPFFAF